MQDDVGAARCARWPRVGRRGAERGREATPPVDHSDRVARERRARQGFWYAGGKYVGELGENKESTMGGAMYVEVMVPKQIRSPYPIVFIHGAGQTAWTGSRRPTAVRVGPTTSSTWATSST